MRRPWIVLVALLAACGGSVGGSGDAVTTPVATPRPTVPGVGSLPDTVPATSALTVEPLVVITRPLTVDGELAELIGDQVAGNRLLMIGDSIFAGAETRYGGELCAGLEPLGWAVEVAAEAGRFVEFGVSVVNRLVPEPTSDDSAFDSTVSTEPAPADDDDWDAAAVFLGSNYDGNQANYDMKMRAILDRLASRPTLLFTVTEYRTNYSEVTEVIEGLAADYPNVTLIDWATAARTPGVLRPDGLHPNDAGEIVLVDLTAAALGEAPTGESDCIRSRFRDDSAISEGNGSPNTGGSSSGSTSRGSSSSSGGSSSSGSSSSGGSSTSGNGSSDSGTTGTSTDGGTGSDGGNTDTTDTDSDGSTDAGTTDGGTTDGGSTDGGSTDGGSTDGGTTDGGSTDGGTTDGGTTDGGTTDGGTTDGGTTDGGTTDGGSTDGGSTDGGATDGGSTDGGATDGGATADDGSADSP